MPVSPETECSPPVLILDSAGILCMMTACSTVWSVKAVARCRFNQYSRLKAKGGGGEGKGKWRGGRGRMGEGIYPRRG